MENNKKTRSVAQIYLLKLVNFYFAPRLRSVFRIIYLTVCAYAIIYYFHYLRLSIEFIFYTLINPTVFLSISHLFWGVTFILAMFFPFSLSVYAVLLLYRIWESKDNWTVQAKWIITVTFIVCGLTGIVLADDIARYVAKQDELRSFIDKNYLGGRI